jgi:hypothetical protein
MKVYMRGSFERSLPTAGMDHFDADTMVALMQRLIEGAAAAGNCVIVGRGAPYFLRDRQDAFHVLIYAPWDEKIRRVRMSGKSEAEAVELVSEIDQERATFIRKYFRKEWPTRDLYHLMIKPRWVMNLCSRPSWMRFQRSTPIRWRTPPDRNPERQSKKEGRVQCRTRPFLDRVGARRSRPQLRVLRSINS